MGLFELLLCAILILTSAFMSASEIALFSLTRFQLKTLKERTQNIYRRTKRLLADPSGLLVTVLVVNEGVNITLSALITHAVEARRTQGIVGPLTQWISYLFPNSPSWLQVSLEGTLIAVPIVLILCDMTPKVIAANINGLITTLTVTQLALIYQLLSPVRAVLGVVVNGVARAIGTPRIQPIKEEEVLVMLEESQNEGSLQKTEARLIKNVFAMDDRPVSEIITPLAQAQTIASNTPIKQALEQIQQCQFSRIPIVDALDKKKVVGIAYRKDLLLRQIDTDFSDLKTLMHKPLLIAANTKLNTVFRRLKQNHTHIAVVQSEKGTALGIVTMSDVLESLFEDVFDFSEEDDEEEA